MKKGLISLALLLVFSISGCNHTKEKDNSESKDSVSESASLIESESEESISEEESPSEESTSPVDPNAKYYESVDTSSKANLNKTLQTLMFNSHKTYLSYGDIRNLFRYSDKDPNKSGNILCFYSRESMNATWDQGTTYNREHVWPKAKSGGLYNDMSGNTYKGAGSDLHHVRPAKTSLNEDRGSKKFGSYVPKDEVKGDCARIIMYLYVHYSTEINGGGTNRATYAGNLVLTNVFNNISLIKSWNELDPVDDLERTRNEYVYSKQGNRNPFIDHPEWVNKSLGY